jgi:Uma2 family endonuclease
LITPLSEADYLAGESAGAIRHEYVAGEVFAMAGGSKAHNTISLNIATLFNVKQRAALTASPSPAWGRGRGEGNGHGVLSFHVPGRQDAMTVRSKLRGSGCQTFIADMRVRIASQSSYYYPDVVVTCAPGDLAADSPKDYIASPSLIVEVLSPTTEAIDRREKMLAYRQIESLREYVLVDQERRWVEVYRRTESGWVADMYSPEDTVTLNLVNLKSGAAPLDIDMAELYEGSGVA